MQVSAHQPCVVLASDGSVHSPGIIPDVLFLHGVRRHGPCGAIVNEEWVLERDSRHDPKCSTDHVSGLHEGWQSRWSMAVEVTT